MDFRLRKRLFLLRLITSVLPLKARSAGPPEKVTSILLLLLERNGDSILSTPLIQTLRIRFPHARIEGIATNKRAFEYFSHMNLLDNIYYARDGFFKTILRARRTKYDLLLNLKDNASMTFLLLARLSGARFSLGLDAPFHKEAHTAVLPQKLNDHILLKLLQFANYLGATPEQLVTRPLLPETPCSDAVREFSQGLSKSSSIAVNLSAGSRSREWSLQKWSALISGLTENVVVLSMPERAADKCFLEDNHPNVLKSPPVESFAEVGTILRSVKLLITPDTALVHAASATDTPVIALYSTETDYERFAPFGVPNERILSTSGIEDVSVERVIEAVKRLT